MPNTFGPSAANIVNQMTPNAVDSANMSEKGNPQLNLEDKNKKFLEALDEKIGLNGDVEVSNMEDFMENADLNNDSIELKTSSNSYFSLSKFSQMSQSDSGSLGGNMDMDTELDMGMQIPEQDSSSMPSNNESFEQNSSELVFNNTEELRKLIDQNVSNPDFKNELMKSAPVDASSLVSDGLSMYYEPETTEGKRAEIAGSIFDAIHGQEDNSQVVGTYVSSEEIEKIVKEANSKIKIFAKEQANKLNKTASSFNLKKQAQSSRSVEFVNFGPESKRIFPYSNTGMLGSEYHTWIRARDHNFIFDDHAVDFETFWRGNIMDKYSQPYRNNKGEWVGGYINKRFDVEHNIPEGNNMQLLPGQIRRPYMPEFATLEARMEDSRKKLAEERGYSPTDEKSKAYNWKEASLKKK